MSLIKSNRTTTITMEAKAFYSDKATEHVSQKPGCLALPRAISSYHMPRCTLGSFTRCSLVSIPVGCRNPMGKKDGPWMPIYGLSHHQASEEAAPRFSPGRLMTPSKALQTRYPALTARSPDQTSWQRDLQLALHGMLKGRQTATDTVS